MSLAEIEAELKKLNAEELRRLALESWSAFRAKESGAQGLNECDEDDPKLLAALDEAIEKADTGRHRSYSAPEVRDRLRGWTSK